MPFAMLLLMRGFLRRMVSAMLTVALTAALTAQSSRVDKWLAQYPANDLPRWLLELTANKSRAPAALRALGAAAHEPLLGIVLRGGARPRQLHAAFGGFDERCWWAVPLLAESVLAKPRLLLDPVAQRLLLRLGPAVVPFLPQLQAAGDKQGGAAIGRFLDQLVRSTDRAQRDAVAGVDPVATPVARRAPAELVPELLQRLARGPAQQRWPCLQALLACGDDVVVDAVEVLLALELADDGQTAAQAVRLLAAMQCIYSARCEHDAAQLEPDPEELFGQHRRRLLAGLLVDENWLAMGDAPRRRLALLQCVVVRDPVSAPVVPKQATDSDELQRVIALVRRVLRQRARLLVAEALPILAGGSDVAQRAILRKLAWVDLTDAGEPFYRLLVLRVAVDSGRERSRHRGDHDAQQLISRVSRLGPPKGLLRQLPVLHGQPGCQFLARTLIKRARPVDVAAAITDAANAAMQDSANAAAAQATLTNWFALLFEIRHSKRIGEVVSKLGEHVTNVVARMPLSAQADYASLGSAAMLSNDQWRRLLTATDVVVRRRAVQAAWRQQRDRQLPMELFDSVLRDSDRLIAMMAPNFYFGCTDKQAVARALLDGFADAGVFSQASRLRVLGMFAITSPAAMVAARLAAANEHYWPRIEGLCLQVRAAPHDEALRKLLMVMFDDPEPTVRHQALFSAGNLMDGAAPFFGVAVAKMRDADDNVAMAAARLIRRISSMRERALFVLESERKRLPQQSDRARRIRQYVRSIERQREHDPGK